MVYSLPDRPQRLTLDRFDVQDKAQLAPIPGGISHVPAAAGPSNSEFRTNSNSQIVLPAAALSEICKAYKASTDDGVYNR